MTHAEYKRLRKQYATGDFVNNDIERQLIGFIAESDTPIPELETLSAQCLNVQDKSWPDQQYYLYRVFAPYGLPYDEI